MRLPLRQAANTIIVVAMAATRSAVDAYLDHLRVERRLADHTLESYARDLRGAGGVRRRRRAPASTRSIARRSKRSSASR